MVSLRKAIIGVVVVVAVAACGSLPLLSHYLKGNLTFSQLPSQEKPDAVMVFTGSSDRLVEGYNFYLKGLSKKLMITGYDYPQLAKEPSVRKLLRKVQKGKVYIDLKARNTIENAQNGAQWALKNHVKSILLVTTEGHMPRAYFELRRLLPPDVKVYTNAVPGKIKYAGIDSERGRLLCRMYETATGTSFCYQTRSFVRSLHANLL